MSNKRKIFCIVAMIILILTIVLLVARLVVILKNKNNSNKMTENAVIENEIDYNNISNEFQENNVEENEISENIVNEVENKVGDTVERTPVADSEQEIDKQTIEKQENNQQKAINIAKKDWGDDNSVYFSLESENPDANGNYTVCVRENSTTHVIRTYIVNVINETLTVQE